MSGSSGCVRGPRSMQVRRSELHGSWAGTDAGRRSLLPPFEPHLGLVCHSFIEILCCVSSFWLTISSEPAVPPFCRPYTFCYHVVVTILWYIPLVYKGVP